MWVSVHLPYGNLFKTSAHYAPWHSYDHVFCLKSTGEKLHIFFWLTCADDYKFMRSEAVLVAIKCCTGKPLGYGQ